MTVWLLGDQLDPTITPLNTADHVHNHGYAHYIERLMVVSNFALLYWDFLKRNEETLRGTGRIGLMYSHVDRKDDEE